MKNTVKFGELEFDCQKKLLKRNGKPVPKLNDNDLNLLKFFAEHSGYVVSKKEVGNVLVKDFDESKNNQAQKLTDAISSLRKKLGDERSHIETISRVGFRFNQDSTQKLTKKKEKEVSTKSSEDMIRFFGQAILEKPIKMVFAYRKHEGASSHMKSILNPPVDDKDAPMFEGVSKWLPYEDNRSSIYLANLFFQSIQGKGFKFYDENYDEVSALNTTISFGLFNNYTLLLSKLCNRKLFQVKYDYSPKRKDLFTDNIAFDDEIIIPKDDEDIAIVARIVSHPDSTEPDACRVQFVVAGRTATGTAVGGRYIQSRWKTDLLKLYDEDKTKELDHDSLAVIISHTATEKDDENLDSTGKIATDNENQPLIRWARHD